jgi:hypothetical protein
LSEPIVIDGLTGYRSGSLPVVSSCAARAARTPVDRTLVALASELDPLL